MSDESYEAAIIRATAAPFIVFPTAALVDRRMTHLQRTVLLCLCWHSNQQHLVWASQKTVAEELGLAQSKVSGAIAGLLALGYLEIVRRAYRGAQDPMRRTNMYRVIWQQESHLSPEGMNESHLSPQGISIYPLGVTHLSPEGMENNTNEQDQRNKCSSTLEVIETSYARSADQRPPESGAPTARKSGFDSSALKRDPLYDALTAFIPAPITGPEWRTWAAQLNALHRVNASPDDITQAVNGYYQRYPKAQLTIRALVAHWAEVREGKSHDIAKLEAAQRASQARQAARNDAEAERETSRTERDALIADILRDAGADADSPRESDPRNRR